MTLLDLVFRANPRYELVVFDRLPPAERALLAALPQDPDLYGALRPVPGSGLGWKAVDRDTALLLFTLREPGPLPAYVAASLGAAALRTVGRLVAEDVLEADAGEGFVSGAAASGLLATALPGRDGREESAGRLRALSRAALLHAQALPIADPRALADHLYAYNRRPLTPSWKRRLPDGEAVRGFLGVDAGGRHRRLLDGPFRDLSATEHWLSWRTRTPGAAGAGEEGRVYKLYLSTPPEALGESFGEILAALAAAAVPQFKVGAGARGLLRPDKLVAHFGTFEQLAAAAGILAERLAGLPVQGVPFTAEIGGDGLLSWGADPPAAEARLLAGASSWRSWLCRRLAQSILDAKAADAPLPWRFALDRLHLEGIDTGSWTPGARLWS